MVTLTLSLVLLVLGYFVYGRLVMRIFGPRPERSTPAYTMQDGVDYLPMKGPRNAMIQLLNIAGVGPIFGPILGALYGPVAFLWIVFGAIFAGAVHDYLTGMISVRNHGAHLPELAGKYLGSAFRHIVNFFSVLLLLLVGTVFVSAPSSLIHDILGGWGSVAVIAGIIYLYYILATMMPIDKIIGRIYPYLGALLVFSALGVGISMIFSGAQVPELTFSNLHPDDLPIYPLLFLTISCGALSGFHATQSPIISRTIQRESQGRQIFYGMMIAEAVIAMIWAAAAMSLFYGRDLSELISTVGPAGVVREVSLTLLGTVGGTLAILGVIVLPVTSGDTAFRSARMILGDYFGVIQKKVANRLGIALPLFVISYGLTFIDFSLLWRYFSWANQSTAMLALWVGAVYLAGKGKNHWIATIPATFITSVCFTYIINAPIGFGQDLRISTISGALITAVILSGFLRFHVFSNKRNLLEDD